MDALEEVFEATFKFPAKTFDFEKGTKSAGTWPWHVVFCFSESFQSSTLALHF